VAPPAQLPGPVPQVRPHREPASLHTPRQFQDVDADGRVSAASDIRRLLHAPVPGRQAGNKHASPALQGHSGGGGCSPDALGPGAGRMAPAEDAAPNGTGFGRQQEALSSIPEGQQASHAGERQRPHPVSAEPALPMHSPPSDASAGAWTARRPGGAAANPFARWLHVWQHTMGCLWHFTCSVQKLQCGHALLADCPSSSTSTRVWSVVAQVHGRLLHMSVLQHRGVGVNSKPWPAGRHPPRGCWAPRPPSTAP
jgi:hypothetical protein